MNDKQIEHEKDASVIATLSGLTLRQTLEYIGVKYETMLWELIDLRLEKSNAAIIINALTAERDAARAEVEILRDAAIDSVNAMEQFMGFEISEAASEKLKTELKHNGIRTVMKIRLDRFRDALKKGFQDER